MARTPVTYRPRPFWSAQIVGWVGTSMQMAVLPLWLYSLTGSTNLALGGFIADALTRALVSPVSGTLVARFSPVRVMLAADLLSAVATVALALVVTDKDMVPWAYPLLAVTTLAMQAYQIGLQTLVPRLIDRDRLASVNGTMQTVLSLLSMVAGPAAALAGLFLDWRVLILLNGASFLGSLALTISSVPGSEWLAVPKRGARTEHPLAAVARHWRELRHAPVAGFIAVESLMFLCFGASQALLYAVVIEVGLEEGGPSVAALLLGAAVGAVLGGLLLRRYGQRSRLVVTAVGAMSAAGPLLVVAGARYLIAVAVLGTALIGASGNLLIGGVTTAIQRRESGRRTAVTLGVRRGLSSLGQLGCYLWTLWLGNLLGFRFVYVAAGAAACVVALLLAPRIERAPTEATHAAPDEAAPDESAPDEERVTP